jgi:hypothetical protein
MTLPRTPFRWLLLILTAGCVAGLAWAGVLVCVSPESPNPVTGQIYWLPAGRAGVRHYVNALDAIIAWGAIADAAFIAFLVAAWRAYWRRW